MIINEKQKKLIIAGVLVAVVSGEVRRRDLQSYFVSLFEHVAGNSNLDVVFVGLARFEELAKAQIIGDQSGLLKLIFEPATLKLLGVHIIGDGACELVHIGQSVMALGGTMETLRDTVFNYPTLAEAYKVAALDGLNKVGDRS